MAFHAKQLNDVKPEDLADALMALSTEGYVEWQIIAIQDRTDFIFDRDFHEDRLIGRRNTAELYMVLAWGKPDEDEEKT